MKQITLRNAKDLTQLEDRLHFDNGLPVVVAYCGNGSNDSYETGLLKQMAGIKRMCDERWGTFGYNIIWVIQDGSDPQSPDDGRTSGCGAGFAIVVEILEKGYASYLAVHRLDRITRSCRSFSTLVQDILEPNGVEMLVASKPAEGPDYIGRGYGRLARLLPDIGRRRWRDG